MVHVHSGICPGEWDTQNSLVLRDKTDRLIPPRKPDLVIVNRK